MTPTSVLELAYPDPTERLLLHHALALIPSLTSASPVPLSHTATSQFQDFLQPSFDPGEFFENRGTSSSHDAFSLSLLSVGAIIISYFHHAGSFPSQDHIASASSSALLEQQRYFQLASAFVEGSLSLVNASLLVGQVGSGLSETNSQYLSLATGMSVLCKCLAGGTGFSEALTLSRRVIGQRGGPRTMLERANATGNRVWLRRVRTVLEKTVMWSEFTSLSTGQAPNLSFASDPSNAPSSSIFQPEPLADYYFLQFPQASTDSDDWDSVETMLGLPRGMVELLHRVNTLYFVSRPSGPLPSPGEPPLAIDPLWLSQGNRLLIESASWRGRVLQRSAALPDGFSRVDMGVLIYSHMFEIILLIDILAYPPSSEVVQHACLEILRLLELQTAQGLVLALIWPWIISGCPLSGEIDRARVLLIAESIKTVCCFDLHSARLVLQQVWFERDQGQEWTTWRDVMAAAGPEGFAMI